MNLDSPLLSIASDNCTLAGIQYSGIPGISALCFDAVKRFVQHDDRITEAKILSADETHCLLLKLMSEETVAIKSGFSSGYRGEGPRTFAQVLSLLSALDVEIDEIDVSTELLHRLDGSALTLSDLEFIESSRPIRPIRWHDYVFDVSERFIDSKSILRSFRPVLPWAIIDSRIVDLALLFFTGPDDAILTGFRRLEDIVRERIDSDAHATRLFAEAFQGERSKLTWKGVDQSEHIGRAQLFGGAYMAYRNPRAHRELRYDASGMLAEFLMLNQLYLLEGCAIERPDQAPQNPI